MVVKLTLPTLCQVNGIDTDTLLKCDAHINTMNKQGIFLFKGVASRKITVLKFNLLYVTMPLLEYPFNV